MGSDNDTTIFFVPDYCAYVTIVSCSFSILGSVLLVATYLRWKENRTFSRLIITFIAIADFFTAFGYLVMSAFFLHSGILSNHPSNLSTLEDMPVFAGVCKAQSFLTTTSSMWSFWWTVVLAFHLFLSLVFLKLDLSKKLLIVYCILSFGVPLLLTVPAVATGWLGVGCGTTSVTWCYVAAKEDCLSTESKVLEAIEGKMWEILSLVSISVMYLCIWCSMTRIRRRSNPEKDSLLYTSVRTVPKAVDWKILALPVVFLFIRIWGTLRYLLSLDKATSVWLISDGGRGFGDFLALMQSVFDGSQGWVNAIVFLLLSKSFFVWTKQVLHKWKTSCGTCCGTGCEKLMNVNWCGPCAGASTLLFKHSRVSSAVYSVNNNDSSSEDIQSQITLN